jgi:hypothetical protein
VKKVGMPDEAVQFFTTFGNGNLSAGVRKAWERLSKEKEK